MKASPKNPKTSPTVFKVSLNVLGYEGEWVAHALEMDLRGYGKDFEKAVEDLLDLVKSQIQFAHFKGQSDLIYRPAAPVFWRLLHQLNEERIRSLGRKKKRSVQPAVKYDVASIAIPPAWMMDANRSPFCQTDG